MNERPPRDVDDRLADWVDGRLSEKERDRFVAELRVNAQLREDLEQYERTVGVVRAALRAPGPPAGIADRVMAAIASPASAPPRRWTLQRVGWGLAAAAAVLATAVWIDALTPASPSSQDTAAVDRARDEGGAPIREEQVPVPEQDMRTAAPPPPAVDKSQAVEETSGFDAGTRVPSARAPAEQAPAPVREQADDKGKEVPSNKPMTPPDGSAGPGNTRLPHTPAPGGAAAPTGPATGGPGAAPTPDDLRRAAGARGSFAETERADALVPVPLVPVPLVIVEGLAIARASDGEKAEATKDRRTRGAPAAGGGGNAKSGEPKPVVPTTGATSQSDSYLGAPVRLDDAALQARLDAFLADAATASTPPAAVAWTTARGQLRLSPMDAASPDAAPRAGGKADAQPPIVRTWLVEGARADVEVLLARVARFSKEHQLTLRSEETKAPVETRATDQPAAESLERQSGAAAARPEVSRLVLRFHLRPR